MTDAPSNDQGNPLALTSLNYSRKNRTDGPIRDSEPVLRRTGHDHRLQKDEYDGLDRYAHNLLPWRLHLLHLPHPLLPRLLQSLQPHLRQLPESHRQEGRLS